MFRRILSSILIFAMVVTMAPVTAVAANTTPTSGQCGNAVFYSYEETSQVLTISGSGDMWDYSWGSSPFYSTDVVELSIEDGVTSVGAYLFLNCSSLTSAVIPDSVLSIGSSAFSGCTSLSSVRLGQGITSIDTATFYDCSALTSVVIPDNVTSIGYRAFFCCSLLASVSLPNGIETIDSQAFRYCTALKNIKIPESVLTIGSYAFGSCAFETAGPLNGGYDYEFGWTKSIPAYAFSGAKQLESIIIPADISSIGDFAFDGCTFPLEVYVENLSNWCAVEKPYNPSDFSMELYIDGVLATDVVIPSEVDTIEQSTFRGCTSLTHIEIPDSVTSIGERAFAYCELLESITIPKGVMKIEASTFAECTSLTEVMLPDNLAVIESSAFKNCSSLTNIVIPENVKTIDYYVFYGCSSLSNITIPEGVTTIFYGAFSYCSSLTDLIIPDSVSTIESIAFCGCDSLESIIIPDDIERIYESAFAGCDNLKSITLPQDLSQIDERAFSGCISLENINIPDGVGFIDTYAFSNCSALTRIALPHGMSKISQGTFSECSNLTSIVIPSTITVIAISAFYGCEKLEAIYYTGTEEQWNALRIYDTYIQNVTVYYNCDPSILYQTSAPCGEALTYSYDDTTKALTISGEGAMWDYTWDTTPFYDLDIETIVIEDGVTHIGDSAFSFCQQVTTVQMADSVTSIGASAFSHCSKLSAINVSANLETLGESAFAVCSSLLEIDLGDALTTIERYAFFNCYNLISTTLPQTVTSIGAYAFKSCSDFTDIYYAGTAQQWSAIACNVSNAELHSATVHFQGEPTYRFTIDLDGTLASYCAGETVTLTAITPDWKHFLQWTGLDGVNLTGTSVTDTTVTFSMPAQNLTVSALYEDVENPNTGYEDTYITVTYDVCGGDTLLSSSKRMQVGTSYWGELPEPTRAHYTFAGWWVTSTYNLGTQITNIMPFYPTADITIYAKWEKKPYEIALSDNAGTLTAYYGQALGTLPVPTATNLTFDGWYLGTENTTSYQAVTASTVFDTNTFADLDNVTLKAKWSTIPLTAISLDHTSLTMELYADTTLQVTATPTNASNQTMVWTSSDTGVATVSGGTIQAKGVGSCTITATSVDGGYQKTCAITVINANDLKPDILTAADVTTFFKELENRDTIDTSSEYYKLLTGQYADDPEMERMVAWSCVLYISIFLENASASTDATLQNMINRYTVLAPDVGDTALMSDGLDLIASAATEYLGDALGELSPLTDTWDIATNIAIIRGAFDMADTIQYSAVLPYMQQYLAIKSADYGSTTESVLLSTLTYPAASTADLPAINHVLDTIAAYDLWISAMPTTTYILKCPIDVAVKDESGTIVYYLNTQEEGVYFNEYGSFYVSAVDGSDDMQKTIKLIDGYEIEVIGLGDGTMDFTTIDQNNTTLHMAAIPISATTSISYHQSTATLEQTAMLENAISTSTTTLTPSTAVSMQSLSYASGTVTSEISLCNLTQSAVVFMALYENQRQVGLAMQTIDAGTTQLQLAMPTTLAAGAYTAKVFVVTPTTYLPLTQSASKSITIP